MHVLTVIPVSSGNRVRGLLVGGAGDGDSDSGGPGCAATCKEGVGLV